MLLSKTFLSIFLVLIFLSLPFRSVLFAQSNTYQFDVIDTRQGLSNNHVNSVFKDEKGFIWFGTMGGLNRYDGYNFKIFTHKIGDTTSLDDDVVSRIVQGPHHTLWVLTAGGWNIFNPRTEKFTSTTVGFTDAIGIDDDSFTDIVQDKQNNFWITYPDKGLYMYAPSKKTGRLYNSKTKSLAIYSDSVNWAAVDHSGFLWIIYVDGVIEKIDPALHRVVYHTEVMKPFVNRAALYRLFVDNDNDLWIYSKAETQGVYYYSSSKKSLLRIHKDGKGIRLNSDIVNTVAQDNNNSIWIGTDHGGVNLINKKDFSVRYLTNDENDPKSISQNSMNFLYKDNTGTIWVGTYKKGVNRFHESNLKFPLYQHKPGSATSLMYNDVNKFVEDQHGNLWIGTNGGGLIYYNRTLGTYQQYRHTSDANSLSTDVVVSLLIDHENKLWIGTYHGGLDCFDGKTFTHYKHNESDAASLADDRVWEIFEDSQNRLWIGTLTEGLDLFDRKTKKFTHYRSGKELRSGYVCSIIEDKNGNIWLATSNGIDVLDKRTGMFRHFGHVDGDKSSLSHNGVIELLQDSRGLIWAATRDGLDIYDPAKKTFKTYRSEDGLPTNSVLTVLEDNSHNIWVTTPNGISNVIVSKKADDELSLQFKNYSASDGLQGQEFNENAALKLKSGELVMGGPNGFNIFQPSLIRQNYTLPLLAFTDFQIFNNSVAIGQEYNGRVILSNSISEVKEITLKYNQNVFTVEFSALEFLNPDKIRYAYKLEGFSKDWLTTGADNRKATFTNLNPGKYTLLIKASNEDGEWSEPLALSIHVLPPFWLTSYAFLLYALLIIAALILGRNRVINRARTKFQLEQERIEAQRLHELDMMKIKFFTNVSHEFRTPLSLIISPAEKLLESSADPSNKKQFQLIHRNARRLLNLVNQLLDFRKMEEQELKLNKTSGDIVQFILEVSASFVDIAENKNINFKVQSAEQIIFTSFDHDKLERILFNLLSNAFKFTPAGGCITVVVDLISSPERKLQIKVLDTGIGIGKDKQEKIFERFFQNDIPGSMVNQGSGIGLAITKEFVRMHGGTIAVESDVNTGSCFIVTLPVVPIQVENDTLKGREITEETPPLTIAQENSRVTGNRKPLKGKKKTLLLVEDNDDFRFYLKDNLKAFYNIIEAANGKIGWQKALSEHPDLVVCDVSMPEMNGIDLCRKIKDDKRTASVPVILLTALSAEQQQIEGLQTGADDYITKPFNFEILLSKISNFLLQQERLKKTYQKRVDVKTSEIEEGESADQKLMNQLLTVIEKNISNPDFSVEELSRQMFMSRVALYKRVFSLTGKTPIEFVRSIRLQRAAQLLQKKELTVTEVAYEVGFNTTKYFSRYFKMEYGVMPSEYPRNEEA